MGAVRVAETVRVEVAFPPDFSFNVEGFSETVGSPVIDGVMVVDSLTGPENPLRLTTVTAVTVELPGGTRRKFFAAETRKSREGEGEVGDEAPELARPATAAPTARLTRSSEVIPIE